MTKESTILFTINVKNIAKNRIIKKLYSTQKNTSCGDVMRREKVSEIKNRDFQTNQLKEFLADESITLPYLSF